MTTTISRLPFLVLAVIFSMVSAQSQGTVNLNEVVVISPPIIIWTPTPATVHFSNRVPQAIPAIDAPIFDIDGVTPLEYYNQWAVQLDPRLSDTFVAQIYAGPSASSLGPSGYPTSFASDTAGYLLPIYWPPYYYYPSFTVLIPGVEAGEIAQVQVRVWDFSAGSTYDEAVTYGGKHGASAILPIVTGGGTNPPAYLTGLESFHLVQGPPVSPVILVGFSNKTVIASQDIILNGFARGTPPLRYQWYFNGYVMASQTNAVLWLPNFSAGNAGQYQVRVSNHAGSIDSPPVARDLRVMKPPVILVPPPHRSVWIGREAVFRVVTRGTRPLSYQWYHDDAVVPDGTNATLRIHDVKLEDQGDYSVFVSNEANGVWSDPAHLAVLDPSEPGPKILRQPQNRIVRPGLPAVFRVVAVGSGRFHYQWQHNNEDIPNARSPVLILRRAQWTDTGYYTVVVRNDMGQTVSTPASLSVLDPAHLRPEIISQPESQAALAGTQINLRVRVRGTPPLTYQWYFNDVPLPGATSSTLRIESIKPEHTGTYRVVVQNPVGGVSSLGAGINVLYHTWPTPAFHGSWTSPPVTSRPRG